MRRSSYNDKKSIHRGAIIIQNIYALNIGACKYIKYYHN